jgi:iron complex outermembrane receptor protein
MKQAIIAPTLLAFFSGVAHAQLPQSERDLARATVDDSGMGDIVVTAQKRAESVQKVPIAITAVSGKLLAEQNINSPQALSTVVSGLHFVSSGIANSPYIRSFGTNTTAAGNEPPAAVYVDGIYIPSPSAAFFSMNAVERIEVLKGPQGTLFGRNAAAGAVQIITRTPSFTPTADIKVGYANYNTISGNFYGTTGLTETLAVALSLSGSKQYEGWGKNLFDGRDVYLNNNINANFKIRWELDDATTITLQADYDRTRADAGGTISALPGYTKDKTIRYGGFFDIDSDARDQPRVSEQGGASLHIEHDFPWATLTSITSGRRIISRARQDTDVSPSPIALFDFATKETTYTQEINLQSRASSAIKWILGLYYYNDRSGYAPFQQIGTSSGQGANGALIFDVAQQTDSYAGYAQATAPLWGDDAHVTAGIRYTNDNRKIAHGQQLSRMADGSIVVSRTFSPPDLTQNALTYKIGLDYSFTPTVMAYATYNRGFKSGNYNLINPNERPLASEYIDAFELGLKSRFLDNRALLNLSIFYYDISNLQVRTINPVSSRPENSNAAKARYLGIEGQVEFALTDHLQLSANATYVDTEYKRFSGATFFRIGADGTVASTFAGDAAGNQVINTEPLSGSARLRYHVSTSTGQWVASADVSYHSGLYFDPQNILRRPSYTLVGANLGWTSPSAKWGLDLWGQNLLDRHYTLQWGLTATTGTTVQAPPRTYGVAISYHF